MARQRHWEDKNHIINSIRQMGNWAHGLWFLTIIFAFTGVYAATNNINEVYIMCFFGLLGYLMNKFDFSPAAVLLGLILGPICENGFRDMLKISHGEPIQFMLSRPLSVILLFLIFLTIYFSYRQKKRIFSQEKLPIK